MDNLRNKTLSSLKWSGLGQGLKQIIQFVFTAVLARLLSPHDFGLFGMIVVITGFAQLFAQFGLGSALIQKRDLRPEHLHSIFWFNIVTGILLSVLFFLSAPLISAFYEEPALEGYVKVISLTFTLGAFNVVQLALMQKNLQFKTISLAEVMAAVLSGAVSITLAFRGLGPWSLVVQSLLNTVVVAVFLWCFSDWRPQMRFHYRALRELFGYSANLVGFQFFNYWTRNLDNLLIGKFVGTAALGLYARAYNVMLLPLTQINNVLSRVMFPSLSALQHDPNKIKAIYLRANRLIAFVTFPTMLGLCVTSDLFIESVFGAQWLAASPILSVLAIAGLRQSVVSNTGWIFTSLGRTDIQFRWGIFAGIINALSFIAGLQWGAFGVAVSYCIVGYVILGYPVWAVPGKLINLRVSEILKSLSGVFFASLIMAAIVLGLRNFILLGQSPLARLMALSLAGCIIYIPLIKLFNSEALSELMGFVRGNSTALGPKTVPQKETCNADS